MAGPEPQGHYSATYVACMDKAAGVTLGTPLSISEEGSPGPVFRGKMMAAAPMATTPVAQGEQTISVTVSVSWAIKPGQ